MNAFMNSNLSEFHRKNGRGLIAHLMVVTHFLQKSTLEKLSARPGYEKLNLSYQGYISLLAERDFSPGELAARLGISKQACSKTVRELESLGLIERRKNPEDSRSSWLSLTAKGLALLQDGIDATNQAQQQFAEKVGTDRLEQLIAVLDTLCGKLAIELPKYAVFGEEGEATSVVSGRPSRLNLLLPKLSQVFHQSLLKSLSDKGFQGLKPSLGQVLGMIRPEGGRIQYIASVIGVSKQAVAAIAAELEQAGYIRREADPADKRQVILKLSENGLQLLSEAERGVRDLEAEIATMLSEEDYHLLEGTMAALYIQVVDDFDQASVLPEKIRQLSEYLVDELGAAGARALAQQLITITRGKL